ncbi:FMN-binding protein [Streptococcus sp. DD12]|uniref:FMN-binding protein n=1 Tax=Streptococcus sp. DD12 TaxID=1777880 RepID=UPI0018D47F95|nr:FMN-binding protein [Streptococcus sp. DD12]
MKKNTQNLILGGAAFTAVAANAVLLLTNNLAKSDKVTTANISASSPASGTTTSTSANSTASLTDGSFTGAVTSTNRGDYQVQITVASGQITAIDVLEFPNENARSQQINADALPVYTQEALANQSANVQLISGATEAFNGFTGSLQDAINQANA